MQLKYVGPKPIISHTSVTFDNNKEDKYVYLNIAIQLIKSLADENLKGNTYKYHADTSRLKNDELLKELKKYCQNIEELMDRENHTEEDEIEHTMKRAEESRVLNQEEKITLENNIEIMHDYLVQRSINKAVYYCAIEKLANVIANAHVEYIIVPMFEKFTHVLHSVQGALLKRKNPIDTQLEIFKEDNVLHSKLKIVKLLS
jgi:ABC-type phosphate transport system auxiliary subunit